ncbi:MAG: class I SAM-dependent methyltransferase, partial [Chloroflexales bacterium]|nr:class I SAM-dependent methyltransferase [Chloroflexales bacterium]
MNVTQLPFDQYGRYRMAQQAADAAANALGQPRLRVLDVGGFFQDYTGTPRLPAPLFLVQHDVTVLDRPDVALPGYVRGDGNDLDFADSSFDLVITCDTLEHIPAASRARFIGELLRVARYGVALICPMADERVVLAERILAAYVRAEFDLEQPQLVEHREYGLPELPVVQRLFHDAGCATRAYPSGDVFAWLPMMLAKHYLGAQGRDEALNTGLDELYNTGYAENDRREPSYRHMVVAAKENANNWLEAVDAALAPTIRAAHERGHEQWLGLSNQLLGLIQLGIGDRSEARRQAFLRSENAFLRDQIGLLDRALADQAQHIHHLIDHSEKQAALATMYQGKLAWRE